MRSLWQFLHLMCVAITVGSSLAPAKIARTGLGGHVLAVFVGLAVGGGCAWAMWTAGGIIVNRIRRLPESSHEGYFRTLYFAAMFWIVFSSFAGFWASFGLLRLLS